MINNPDPRYDYFRRASNEFVEQYFAPQSVKQL